MTNNSDAARKISQFQARIYEHLIKRGKVTSQVACSQPISESRAMVITDAIRVAKDDGCVAEAVAAEVDLPYIGLVEEGIPLHFASLSENWLVYGDSLCITNPCDSGLIHSGTAWARNEGHHVRGLAVISNSYLSQLRASYADLDAESDETVDDQKTLQQLDDIIRFAARMDASDVHFVPGQTDKVDLLFRIDGILRAQRKIELTRYETMVRSVIEQRCNTTYIALREQDGKFQLPIDSNKTINLRCSTVPVVIGSEAVSKLVMRLLGNNTSLANLDRLGLSSKNHDMLTRFGNYPNGMIVMTGPTGSGKTTTLSAQLLYMQSNNPNRNFHTVEDPVEIQHAGMSHTEVTPMLGFAQTLKALLRQDPDVILVGEMRDNETAELGYKAAQTGHLVLTTLHTNNAHESIDRLAQMGINYDLITSNTTAFLAQRLVRCLCKTCRVEHRLKDDPARYKLYGNHKAFAAHGGETIIYRRKPSGCADCGGQGERGRQSILEIFEMTPDAQVALLKGENPALLRRRQIEDGTFEDLWDDALRLVALGVIGFEQAEGELKPYEVNRVGMKREQGSVQSVSVGVAHTQAATTAGQIQSL